MIRAASYNQGADNSQSYRSPHRAIATTNYYQRTAPYAYYEHSRQHVRPQYADRQTAHTSVEDGEADTQGEQQARRRIAVACARCRKRKIKCSGDPGDGTGCAACKGTGPDYDCAFNRVKSGPISAAHLEMLAHGTLPGLLQPTTFDIRSQTEDRRPSDRYHARSWPSMPVLYNRAGPSTLPQDFDAAANASPIDAYPYPPTAISRQDSMTSTYGVENGRSWSASCPTSLPPTPVYYEPHTGCSFGSLQVPVAQQYGRLPSVSAESSSSLNMGHLNSSLPSQTAQDRRLPAPYVSQYPQMPLCQSDVAGGRPFGSFSNPGIPINSIQARGMVPWGLETRVPGPRSSSQSGYASLGGLPATSSQTLPPVSEPALAYHLIPSTSATYCSSPELSPTSGPTLSTSFDSSSSSGSTTTAMLPTSNMRFSTSCSSYQEMPVITSSERPGSSRQRNLQNTPSQYGFVTAPSDLHSTPATEHDGNGIPSNGVTTYSHPVRDTRGSNDADAVSYLDASDSGYQNPIQHPRPLQQHSASIENLCRQSPFEQQTPRSSTSRISSSNFSGSYQ